MDGNIATVSISADDYAHYIRCEYIIEMIEDAIKLEEKKPSYSRDFNSIKFLMGMEITADEE